MRGRSGDAWLTALEALPLPERVAALQKTGFSGLYVERKAFPDHGTALEAQLRALVGAPALESDDGHQAFYRLNPDPAPVITPVVQVQVSGGQGYYAFERDQGRTWGWSRPRAELLLQNFTGKPLAVRFSGELSSLNPRQVQLRFGGQAVYDGALQPGTGVPVALDLTLAPGTNVLAIESDAPPMRLPTDTRALGVMMMQPRLQVR